VAVEIRKEGNKQEREKYKKGTDIEETVNGNSPAVEAGLTR
jgi:hypothetical protein